MANYEVRTAADGADAIERAREFEPHLILMYLAMSRLNGAGATRRVRALPHRARCISSRSRVGGKSRTAIGREMPGWMTI